MTAASPVRLRTGAGPVYVDTAPDGRITAIHVPAENRALRRAILLRSMETGIFLRRYRGLR